jgi:hypothetical protein
MHQTLLFLLHLQVEGIHGMYLTNKLIDNRVKTFITYDKGQTWALLPAPTTDVLGNNLHCVLVSSSLVRLDTV